MPINPERRLGQAAASTRKRRTRTARRYAGVNHSAGPATYRSAKGYDLLYKLGGFKRGGNYQILDAACGKGLVGIEVSKRARRNNCRVHTTFFDLTKSNLDKIRAGRQRRKLVADLTNNRLPANSFTQTFCRYSIKNLRRPQQIQSLKELCRVTKKGGSFILQDMVSPEGLKRFMNVERAAKNQATGALNRMHIPTEAEWREMLTQAGFEIDHVQYTTSKVNTNDWVRSGQMTQESLQRYFRFLDEARARHPGSWEAFNIKRSGKGYEITYPVLIIKAVKPR